MVMSVHLLDATEFRFRRRRRRRRNRFQGDAYGVAWAARSVTPQNCVSGRAASERKGLKERRFS